MCHSWDGCDAPFEAQVAMRISIAIPTPTSSWASWRPATVLCQAFVMMLSLAPLHFQYRQRWLLGWISHV